MKSRFVNLNIEGFNKGNDLVLKKLHYKAKMNETYEIFLTCLYNGADRIISKDMLGKNTTVSVGDGEHIKYLNGIITEVHKENAYESSKGVVSAFIDITIEPTYALLKKIKACRVFRPGVVSDYIKEITGKYNINVKDPGRPDFANREFCIQYKETDFDFLQRLMEAEGIFYYFDQAMAENTLILGTSVTDYSSNTPLVLGDDSADEYKFSYMAEANSVLIGHNGMNDFDYNAPRKSLKALNNRSQSENAYFENNVTNYSYPYPVRSYQLADDKTVDLGKKYSDLLLEAEQSNNEKIHFNLEGVWWGMDVGSGIKIKNSNEELIITNIELNIYGIDSEEFERNNINVNLEAINSKTVYRPLMKTEVPDIPVQTATVVGMADGTLYNKVDNDDDKKILVKVKFHWDLEHMPTSNECSCWIRSGQGWAGNQRGFIFAPRVGDEVIVAFESGHPDTPIIIGSVHNGKNKLPYSLAEKKNLSGIVSRTVPDGKESACILIKDDAGMEELDMYSAGDMNQLAGKNLSIKANGKLNIEASAISLNAYDPQSGKMSFITLTPEFISIMSEMINENTGGAPNVIMAGEIKDKVKPGAYFGGSASSAEDAAKKMAKQEKKNEEMKAKAAKKSAKLAKKGANQGIDAAATGDVSKVTVAQDAVQTAADMGSERASGA